MRILTLTTLYPNAAAPSHGVFVENRLRAFAARCGAEIRVAAPVPWAPSILAHHPRYGAFVRAPRAETRSDLPIVHPRYFVAPRIGMTLAASTLEAAFHRAAEAALADGFDFDLIDAHYFYPDGVAAARVARRLGKPIVITARGTDVNYLPRFPRQRRMILEAAETADAIICVASSLKDALIALGAPEKKIRVLRNGVDLATFRPLDRDACRAQFSLAGPAIASVGHLIERKGHHLVIEALARIEGASLLIAGEGEERARLERLAHRLGVANRVRFLGRIAHDRLAEVYSACDLLVLASSREGWPNVLLEAMACGAPCVATPVWGSREVIAAPEAGRLAADRSAHAIADAATALLASAPSRAATRAYAERFSWDETSDGLNALFTRIIDRGVRQAPAILRRAAQPRLIVTVDTEERFDWRRFEPEGFAICPPEDIDRFQRVAASFSARPLYFLTYPLLNDARCAAYFAALLRDRAADAGIHLHGWVTPPIYGAVEEKSSWQCNLPIDLQEAKLVRLKQAFAAAFGAPPRAHRAGRYGVDRSAYGPLARAGLTIDFSPSPGFDYSAAGGPDFSGMSNDAFLVDAGAGQVCVLPVCGARTPRGSAHFLSRRRLRVGFQPGLGSIRQRILAPLRLSCEGASLGDLKSLTRRLVSDGAPVLTFSLHSTTMTAGANAFARTREDVDRALDLAERYFRHFTKDLCGAIVDLEEVERIFAAASTRQTDT